MSSWDGRERRHREDVKEMIHDAVYTHDHSDDHAFLRAFIKKEERKQELYENLKGRLAGYTMLIVLGFVVVSLWHEIIDVIKGNLGVSK